MATEFWHRLEDYRAAFMDPYDHPCTTVYVRVRSFPVLRTTEKGVWLEGDEGPRFVLRDARKRWACPTLAEAVESFRARKKRQLRLLRAQMGNVERALYLAESNYGEDL